MTEKEFEDIFKSNFASLVYVAHTIIKDSDQAKDIVQQAFIKFWDKRKSVNIHDHIGSYLKKAVINTALNHIEKNKKIQFEDDFSANVESKANNTLDTEERIALIKKVTKNAIDELPEKCSLVFSLSRYDGMANQEIADYLDLSIKSVEKHISKAIKELRIKLKPFQHLAPFFLMLWVGF